MQESNNSPAQTALAVLPLADLHRNTSCSLVSTLSPSPSSSPCPCSWLVALFHAAEPPAAPLEKSNVASPFRVRPPILLPAFWDSSASLWVALVLTLASLALPSASLASEATPAPLRPSAARTTASTVSLPLVAPPSTLDSKS